MRSRCPCPNRCCWSTLRRPYLVSSAHVPDPVLDSSATFLCSFACCFEVVLPDWCQTQQSSCFSLLRCLDYRYAPPCFACSLLNVGFSQDSVLNFGPNTLFVVYMFICMVTVAPFLHFLNSRPLLSRLPMPPLLTLLRHELQALLTKAFLPPCLLCNLNFPVAQTRSHLFSPGTDSLVTHHSQWFCHCFLSPWLATSNLLSRFLEKSHNLPPSPYPGHLQVFSTLTTLPTWGSP